MSWFGICLPVSKYDHVISPGLNIITLTIRHQQFKLLLHWGIAYLKLCYRHIFHPGQGDNATRPAMCLVTKSVHWFFRSVKVQLYAYSGDTYWNYHFKENYIIKPANEHDIQKSNADRFQTGSAQFLNWNTISSIKIETFVFDWSEIQPIAPSTPHVTRLRYG